MRTRSVVPVLVLSLVLAACSNSAQPGPVMTASDTEGRFAGHKQNEIPAWIGEPAPPGGELLPRSGWTLLPGDPDGTTKPKDRGCGYGSMIFQTSAPTKQVIRTYVDADFTRLDETPFKLTLNDSARWTWIGKRILENGDAQLVAIRAPAADDPTGYVDLESTNCRATLSI